MRGNDLLEKMELIDFSFVEAADTGDPAPPRRAYLRRHRTALLIAALLALLLIGAGAITAMYGDLWIESPVTDPAESVRRAIENQVGKDYTIKIEVESVAVDEAETQRGVERFIKGVIAQRRGWSDEYLAEHFVVVKAVYYAQYDPARTTRGDGNVVQYFYLTRDPDSG